VVNPGVVEDDTDSGGSGCDAENRGDHDDAPVPDPVPFPASLGFDLQHHRSEPELLIESTRTATASSR
jgi:hypothetical protein